MTKLEARRKAGQELSKSTTRLARYFTETINLSATPNQAQTLS
jgi:hypothetical protein